MTSVDTIMQQRGDWLSASVVNHTIVTDPTIRQPGFDLPRHTWSLMIRFRTGQGPCLGNLHNGVSPSHLPVIVASDRPWTTWSTTCPLTKFEGRLNLLHAADDDSHMAGIYNDCSPHKILISLYWCGGIYRGDVVVSCSVSDPNQLVCKRVRGLEGDAINGNVLSLLSRYNKVC